MMYLQAAITTQTTMFKELNLNDGTHLQKLLNLCMSELKWFKQNRNQASSKNNTKCPCTYIGKDNGEIDELEQLTLLQIGSKG
jgi:hypothetical protein